MQHNKKNKSPLLLAVSFSGIEQRLCDNRRRLLIPMILGLVGTGARNLSTMVWMIT
jgi:hypothetical protein